MKFILLLLLLPSFLSNAQCTFNNSFVQDATPTNCPGNTIVPCLNGGEFVTVSVTSGNIYSFTTCGSSSFDSQITVFDASGTSVLGYNDDACGLQSTVNYTPSFTGVINVLVDEYNCQNTGSCIDLEISCDTPIVFVSSNLPIVVINTAGGAVIPNDPKLDATMGIIYNGEGVRNYLSDPFNEFNGAIGIETRGSSSQTFPKKQWGLETRDPMGNRQDVTIFNMAFDNDWILYAPYSDKSLIRNVLAYQMGWDSDRYAPRTKLCEVILNGQYEGVYVFTEKIKRKDGKVGSNDIETVDVSGNELTGDYILKVDKTTSGGIVAWSSSVPPYTGSPQTIKFQLHDPSYDSLVPQQLNYIENYVTNFETALNGPNFTDPNLGYAPYIDIGSFIDFMLINEVSKNVDGYRISSFLHKVRTSEGGKLTAGPVWDFNLAFGNANYCNGGNTNGWELDFYQSCSGDGNQNPFWWKKLLQDPNYSHALNCHYQEMRLGKWHTDSLMARIDTLAVYLDEAQERNFQRWPILGNYVWPNDFVGNTYDEEIVFLKTWMTDRLDWLDANMFGSCPDLSLEEINKNQFSVFPNPADEYIEITSDSNITNEEIIIYNQQGELVLKQSILNSDLIDISQLESGMYLYKIIKNERLISTGKLSIR